MTVSVELDSVSAAWELDDLQPADDKSDRVSDAVVAQSATPEAAATPAEPVSATAGEPVPVDVGSGTPAQPAASETPAATPLEYTVEAGNVVRLPDNISIENIRVEGSDLVLEQADGTLITIKDAAANVPTFIIGDVEVPRVALLAALEASGVDVAFGADGSIAASPGSNLPSSSGGNFEVSPGGIGDGFPLTDLLPPTALAFPQYEYRELFVGFEEDNSNPVFADFAIRVSEEGLDSGLPDEEGVEDETNSSTATGTFPATDSDGDVLSFTFGEPILPLGFTELTSGGQPIVWSGQGTGELVGSASGNPIITITAVGNTYSVGISGPIDHPDTSIEDDLTLVIPVTVDDGNGGSVTVNMSVTIEDDSPVQTGSSETKTVYEDELDGGNADANNPVGAAAFVSGTLAALVSVGADEPLTFSLSLDGATLPSVTSKDETVVYDLDGNLLTAYVDSGTTPGELDDGDRQVFTLEITDASTGAYTFTLLDQLDHSGADNDDELLDLDFSSLVVASDEDDDQITLDDAFTIRVENDVPVQILPETGVLVNAIGSTATFDLDTDANIDNNVGADQLGTISFANITYGQPATGVIDGNTVNLTSGGESIELFLVDHDSNSATPDQLQGWTGGLGTGTKIFQVTLQPDGSLGASSDTYTVEVFAAIGATQQTQIDNFSALGQNSQHFKGLDVPETSQDLLFSGFERESDGSSNAGTGSAVSASTTGIGVANNSMDDGDSLRIDFVNDLFVSGGNNNTYDYTTHYDANGFQFSIVQVNGNPGPDAIEVWVRIYSAGDDDPNTTNAADAAALANDPQLNTITEIKVNGVVVPLGSLTSDGAGGYLITGLDLNDTVVVTASGAGYSRIEIENARSIDGNDPTLDGESFDIGAFAFVSTVTNIPSVELNFDLALTDADGDTSLSSLAFDLLSSGTTADNSDAAGPDGVTQTAGSGVQNIIGSDFADSLTGDSAANVLAGLDGDDALNGADGDDQLIGGSGDDTLNGGANADTLTGGGGADTFVYGSGDTVVSIGGSGNAGTIGGYDIITDFDTSVDKLGLSGTPFAAADTLGVDGANSTLTIGGQTVKSHSISNGIITFDDADTYAAAIPLTSTEQVAAVVQYLRANDIGAAGATVAFTAMVGGVAHTYVYQQVGDTPSGTNDILIDLQGITIANLSTLISTNVIDPIILDLDGNGFTFSSLADGASFDINADGNVDRVAWNTSGDGILAMDLDHDGVIDDGSEIFTPTFDGGDFASGSEALASLDTNSDGVIDALDDAFADLRIWRDLDGDGVSDEGELSSLAESGIVGLSASTAPTESEIDGQAVAGEGTFTRTDGSTGTYVEVVLDAALGTDDPAVGSGTVIGTDGDDILAGIVGQVDALVGRGGADTFVINDISAIDIIADYREAEGDKIDLSALLDESFGAGSNEAEFVRVVADGVDAKLQVDVDGGADGENFVDVAVLQNFNPALETVKVLFDNNEHTAPTPTV